MKALMFSKSVPRYALLKLLGPRLRRLYTSGLTPLRHADVPPPRLPSSEWARVRPRLAGICGSDLSTICAKGTPYLAPVTSMPFVMGHEVVGTVIEVGERVKDLFVGDRVVLHPALGCRARGIEPRCDACRVGRDALCRNNTRGLVSPGLQIGFCRDTGGGFGENFVAHRSQLYRVPDGIDDRAAVLIEPFACAMHGALRARPAERDRVLVIGCGAIGLLTIAALRATGCRARIVAIAKYDRQRQLAREFGADELLDAGGPHSTRYPSMAGALNAELLKAEIGKPAVVGGADVTYDCVASSRSIDDGLRFTRGGGTFVLVGMPGMPWGVDWTPMWFKELTVHAAYAYGPERVGDVERDTFDLAIEHMGAWGPRLSQMVGEPFALKDYRAALGSALGMTKSRSIKTVFAVSA